MAGPPKKRKTKSKARDPRAKTKKDLIITRLRRKTGVSLNELIDLTGWQAHSVRGFLSGTVKKRLGLKLFAETNGKGERRYFVRTAS